MSVPEKNYMPGWPYRLLDNDLKRYVLLRDGKPVDEFSGESCLYGLLDAGGYIDRNHQYVPLLGATSHDMRLSGGTWISAEELNRYGQTGIIVPPEPVPWAGDFETPH